MFLRGPSFFILAACFYFPAHAQPAASHPGEPVARGNEAPSRVFNKLRAGEPLVIAFREASIPFSYMASGKEPVGYAIDLCLQLAEVLRKELKLPNMQVSYLPVSAAQRIPSIVEGRADLQCSSTINNAERREKVSFTIPHFITGIRYLVKTTSNIESLEDLKNKRVVSTVGATGLQVLEQKNRELLHGMTIMSAPTHTAAVEMVENGKADAFAMDDIQLYSLAANRPDPKALKVVGKFLTTDALAIMFAKDDLPFKRLVDREMRRLIVSRDIYPIYDKWFMQPIPPKGQSLQLPTSYLLKDFWKYPSDFVPG